MAKKYRKKPVVIEAVQFDGNFEEIESFVGGDAEFRDGKLIIATLEGPLFASPRDYIIKGIKGEFYPCRPDIFEASYEEVDVKKPYGYFWGTRSESVDDVLLWWPTLGKGWTKEKCIADFEKAKAEGNVGKRAKIKIYSVTVETMEDL